MRTADIVFVIACVTGLLAVVTGLIALRQQRRRRQ